jgi:hypothetical protein
MQSELRFDYNKSNLIHGQGKTKLGNLTIHQSLSSKDVSLFVKSLKDD